MRTVVTLVIVISVSLLGSRPLSAQGGPQRRGVDSLGDPLPKNALLRMGTTRFRSPGNIMDMALTNDDKILITIGEYLTAWDAETGRELWRHSARTTGGRLPTSYGVRAIGFLSDGQRVATRGREGTLAIWDARTCQLEMSNIECPADAGASHSQQCISIDVSNDGKLFAVGTGGGMKVSDAAGKVLYEFEQQPRNPKADVNSDRLHFGGQFHYGLFSPDARTFARVDNGSQKTIRLYEATTGEELREINCKANVVRIDFSPNSQQLAVTERDTAVRLYHVATGELVWETIVETDRTIENYTSAIKFSPHGKLLAVAERQQRLMLLAAETGKEIGQFKNHGWNPWAVAFTSDSNTLYSSGWGGVVHRWDVETLEQIPVPNAVLGTSVVAASRDGKTIAHSDQSGNVHLIAMHDGKQLRALQIPGARYGYLAFSPDNQHLAAGGTCNKKVHLSLWDYHKGELKYRWDWDKGRDPHCGIEEIQFSSDGSLLAAASFRQDAAHLWDTTTGKRIARMRHRLIYGMSFSADDKTLVTAGWDRALRFWDSTSGDSIDEFEIPEDEHKNADLRMYTVHCDPAGELIATTHLDDLVRLWNADDRKPRGALEISGSFVFGSSCFSPDGSWFATGGTGTIEIWDPWSGTKLHEFEGHEDHVYTIEFAGDNLTLVSGAASEAYLWDLRPTIDPRALSEHLDALITTDDAHAYQAWWALLDGGDESVKLIGKLFTGRTKLLNTGRMASGIKNSERERRLRLLKMMADKNDDTMRLAVANRMISVLSHIGTDSSKELLAELARQDDDFGSLVTAQLKRNR